MARRKTQMFTILQLVLLGGLGLFTALLATSSSQGFSPDSTVYVDAANHIAAGEGFTTTILFTDSEPIVPTPLTTWPPLYPATIAGVHKLGISTAVAARIVPLVAFSLSVVLLWLIASMLFGRTVAWISALLLIIFPEMTRVAATAWSESLFVFLLLAAVWATTRSLSQTSLGRRNLLLILGGLAMGGAALTRYVGIVLIPVGGVLLIVSLWTNRPRTDWLLGPVFWCLAAGIPIGAWLLRNLLVAGNFAGERKLSEVGPLFLAKTVLYGLADDAFALVGKLTILPDLLRLGSGFEVMEAKAVRIAILAIVLLALLMALRRNRIRIALADAFPTLWGSRGMRFAVGMGVGYLVALVALRSVVGTADLLGSRILMPSYPLLLVGVVAFIVVVASKLNPRLPRYLAGGVAALSAIAIIGVMLPESLSAGGPTLGRPDPPTSVSMLADITGPDSFLVGYGVKDYNFYLGRPVLSMSTYKYSSSHFDCRKISNILTEINQQSYFIFNAQSEGFDANYIPSTGIGIERLLNGESQLPLVPVYLSQELAVYKIVDNQWPCE